jgi:dTMP kinase
VSSFADEVAALRGTRPATFKDLITHPAFSKLLAAQTVSSFGDWVGFVAVTALVASKGGEAGAYAIAGVMLARTLPAILFGPVAGAIVDRVNLKNLMITEDI